jgi:hypothetical protein
MIPELKVPPVRSTTWQLMAGSWQLVNAEIESTLVSPDGRPLWREITCRHIAEILADACIILELEKVPRHQRAQRKLELAPNKAQMVDRFLFQYPGQRSLEDVASLMDFERVLYRLAIARVRAPPQHDRNARRRLRRTAAALRQKLEAELRENGRNTAQHDELLTELSEFQPSPPTRFQLPWHSFAGRMFHGFVGMTRDPRTWPRSSDALGVRFVQQALAHIGVVAERPAILKVVLVIIKLAEVVFQKPQT